MNSIGEDRSRVGVEITVEGGDLSIAGVLLSPRVANADGAFGFGQIKSSGASPLTQPSGAGPRATPLDSRVAANGDRNVSREALAKELEVRTLSGYGDEAHSHIIELERDLKVALTQVLDLQNQLTTTQTRHGQKCAEVAQLRIDLRTVRTENANLQTKGIAANSRTCRLERDLGTARTQVVGLQAQIGSMQVQIAGLHSLMMAAQRTMGTARTENADLRVQLALMQVHDGQKNAEIARLRGAVAEKITLAQIMADNENAEQNSGEWRLA